MTDIVERLKDAANDIGVVWVSHDANLCYVAIATCKEAADYIEMLRGRVIAFESLETKRMKDAVTAEDWRRIAEHM
jgi:hypothetical protein